MVVDFLKKYQEELISQKIDTKEQIDLLNAKIIEETKFLTLLEQSNDSYYSVFTPRNLNEKNIEKADQIKNNLSSLQLEIDEKNNLMRALDSRLQELGALINNVSVPIINNSLDFDSINLKNKLNEIKSFIIVDPMRAEKELDSLINKL